MENSFLQQIQQKVSDWRNENYKGVKKETLNILNHIKRVGFLHKPQVEAFETYIYLKEIIGNKSSVEVFKSLFTGEKEMLLALGVSREKAFDLFGDKKKIEGLLIESFGESDYANQVYALTMGAGKTILMSVMMIYDFTLSFYYPDDERFAKNALIFAPDTTIIESLKEIKTFDYAKVLPKEYENIILNIKYYYLEDTATPLSLIGNYNVVVSNSQKIILKTHNGDNGNATKRLFGDWQELGKREIENRRLQAIRELKNLVIFVDEAHHSYGTTLEGDLKKTRQTINYIHKEGKTPLISVINLTGTPYVQNRMIADVVYHFGLKQGIEQGILKQVRFFEYGNVKTDKFIEDVIDNFWAECGENRLENKLPKIAFYSASINELRELKEKLEKMLIQKDISTDKVLEFHTEAEKSKEDFILLDTPQSDKQFILLVGKGTEGWNCRSLVACALYRKPKSSIFVLQASTRCLRSIGDNKKLASIFLSSENYHILDKELKNNFSTSISELSAQDQKSVEHTLRIEKKKKIKVNKMLKEIIAVQNQQIDKIKVDFSKFNPQNSFSFVSEGGIFLNEENQAGFKQSTMKREIKDKGNFSFYEIIEIINRYTHLSCLAIEKILENSGLSRQDIENKINDNSAVLGFVVQSILANAYNYEEKKETIEEEIELTKMYPVKISIEQGKNILVVYREQMEKDFGKSRIGFHINPYNFDSGDEKDLFKYLRNILDKDEAIVDVYFTGGVAEPSHNDFYFEYYSPDNKKISRYFPDFLIETSKGRYLVVEVKASKEKETYERNKQEYKGDIKDIFDEVFAKELGFREFQEANKDFEYKIIFDASLQQRQQELLESIKKYA